MTNVTVFVTKKKTVTFEWWSEKLHLCYVIGGSSFQVLTQNLQLHDVLYTYQSPTKSFSRKKKTIINW